MTAAHINMCDSVHKESPVLAFALPFFTFLCHATHFALSIHPLLCNTDFKVCLHTCSPRFMLFRLALPLRPLTVSLRPIRAPPFLPHASPLPAHWPCSLLHLALPDSCSSASRFLLCLALPLHLLAGPAHSSASLHPIHAPPPCASSSALCFLLCLMLPPPPHASSSTSRFLLCLMLPLCLTLPSASLHFTLPVRLSRH
ncbi:hypothetical protein B0H13DRAFT_2363687 [Mycena leptocephala]|nr:hypothetical protein B0H13DRAFT_2363687 [Mycena leptocephala]